MDDTKRRCAVCESRSVGREGRDLSFGNAAQIALWFHGAATGGDCEEEWEEIVSKRRESRLEKVLTSVSCIAKMCACWCNWCCCAKNLDEVDMRTKLDAYNNEAKAQSKVRAPRRKKNSEWSTNWAGKPGRCVDVRQPRPRSPHFFAATVVRGG